MKQQNYEKSEFSFKHYLGFRQKQLPEMTFPAKPFVLD
jgi:hypothetical protein